MGFLWERTVSLDPQRGHFRKTRMRGTSNLI